MKRKQHYILLPVDNCPVHLANSADRLSRILPPNTTSVIQPCDQGIIKNQKTHYRSLLVNIPLMIQIPTLQSAALTKHWIINETLFLSGVLWSSNESQNTISLFHLLLCVSHEINVTPKPVSNDTCFNSIFLPSAPINTFFSFFFSLRESCTRLTTLFCLQFSSQ